MRTKVEKDEDGLFYIDCKAFEHLIDMSKVYGYSIQVKGEIMEVQFLDKKGKILKLQEVK